MKNDVTANRSFKPSKAIITGGSSGIGWEITKQLKKRDSQTVILDIKPPLTEYNDHFLIVDFQKQQDYSIIYDKIIEILDTPDILILNAGRGIHEKLTEGNPDTWEEIFQINLFSCLRLIRAFTPDMLTLETADIVFISSVSSKKAFPYGGIYGASKAALDMIAETLRLEVQPTIRVTTVHPGVVDTDFFSNIIHGEQTPESIGWGSIDPAQVASAVLYALGLPPEIALNNLTIRPSGQPL